MAVAAKFPLEELVKLPIFVFPQVSWSGDQVGYYTDESGRMEFWVMDLTTGQHRQVSHGEIPTAVHAGFAWDRNGRSIVFARDVNGNEQHDLWRLDIESSHAEQLTDTPSAQEIPIEFSPDDERVSFLSTRNGQLNLFSMRRDGSDVRQLTAWKNPAWGGRWSPDGTQLASATSESENLHNADIYLVAADGSGARQIFSSGGNTFDVAAGWSPDGQSLAITSDASGVDRPGILDVASGQVRWLGIEGVDETACGFSPDGTLLLTQRNQDARVLPVIYEVESGAERVPVLPAGGSLSGWTNPEFARSGEAIVFAYSTDATRPELLLYDLDSASLQTLIPAEYGSIDPAAFVMAEDVYYPSFDGLRIHALLYHPRDASPSHRVPAVVMPHGGPTWNYSHIFDPYVQFLVNEGYAVLLPNIRGSTGYGVEFRDMARHDWGGADLQDIVAGRNYLASLPFVDPDRIAVFGGSYGGFMTFIAMTKAPENWKAGVAWVGVSDLPAMYEESMPHFKSFLEEQMGNPQENAALWRDRSAVNFADRMQGKLLIVHGINDPRCPISQARIFRDRLLELGKVEGRDFEYVELGEEGHGSTDQAQRLRSFKLVADFFARNL